MKNQQTDNHGFAYLSLDLSIESAQKSNGKIQIFPWGEFSATDGRPEDTPNKTWLMNNEVANRIIGLWSAKRSEMMIDYEHSTLAAQERQSPNPAAGWIKRMYAEEHKGLFAEVEWTALAKNQITTKQYRFTSPLFIYDIKTGEILALINVALTNTPALDWMSEATAANRIFNFTNKKEETQMTEQKDNRQIKLATSFALAALATLGLNDQATDQQVKTAFANFEQKTLDEALKKGTVVKTEKLSEIQTEHNKLKEKISKQELSSIITVALSEGQISKNQKDWAESLTAEALTSFLKTVPKKEALLTLQTTSEGTQTSEPVALSEIHKKMGISKEELEEFRKNNKGDA